MLQLTNEDQAQQLFCSVSARRCTPETHMFSADVVPSMHAALSPVSHVLRLFRQPQGRKKSVPRALTPNLFYPDRLLDPTLLLTPTAVRPQTLPASAVAGKYRLYLPAEFVASARLQPGTVQVLAATIEDARTCRPRCHSLRACMNNLTLGHAQHVSRHGMLRLRLQNFPVLQWLMCPHIIPQILA